MWIFKELIKKNQPFISLYSYRSNASRTGHGVCSLLTVSPGLNQIWNQAKSPSRSFGKKFHPTSWSILTELLAGTGVSISSLSVCQRSQSTPSPSVFKTAAVLQISLTSPSATSWRKILCFFFFKRWSYYHPSHIKLYIARGFVMKKILMTKEECHFWLFLRISFSTMEKWRKWYSMKYRPQNVLTLTPRIY